MNPINGAPRRIVLALVAAAACLAIAACGSSSSSGSGGSATTSTSASAPAGAGAARTKLEACLKQHGVTLPSRPGGFRPGGGGTGTTPGANHPGGGSFFGGGGSGRGRFFNSKTAAALKACGANFGAGRFGPGAGAGRFRPHFTASVLASFAACVKKHGYTLPKANTSGTGGIYPTSVEHSKKFQAASKACTSVLRSAFRPPPTATTNTNSSS